MILTDLEKEKNKVVGTKQSLKAIKNGEAKVVFIAEDVDLPIKKKIMNAVNDNNVPVEIVESKLKLGRACGIDVSAACAVILK